MAVCALTMLEGMENEVVAAGGALLLALALIMAWLSTHVADRGDHILGTILTVGAHASLIGLGAHDNYSGGPNGADAPEQQAAQPSQENKPDDGEPSNDRGEGDGEGTEDIWTDLRLDIQSKQPQVGMLHSSDGEEDEENEDEEDELRMAEQQPLKAVESLSTMVHCASTSISVRLKFLNDTEEVAVVEPEDTVGILTSKCFSGREHQVKLIYRGQLLQDPKKTLFSLNITNNSVIHCHISQAMQGPNPEEGAQPGAGTGVGPGGPGGFRAASVAINTSSLVVPVFVVILAVVWYFRINYRQFFTAPATISLVGVTVFFSFLIFGMHSR
ncbi:transmembrane and ubiquitin-like domain-containing protein 2 [Cyprinodon tularosa]|uniref:Transmembrane and ubiquitin-like domain containing 2 n=1 Tax=Cyprinodon variegatus TaxID=28743 RepID=A0A3Q2D624_CYPVA|nr:PREDICTED: transmembrane and ubiquitin-like domain-containing protein 2 [Cyprinodon variegatus]XP_015227556.1 PREDICTED: transmembrane and ubiquitin-like domain-containing protein 2 [Cyprinodon variegatus]XP_038143782.1 transmembrane and ubiquitin-like domain-containing protein 2 [Cyprinodon tularosa]XP_038143783.1 transmembrane and ubiquitin-like domain-containing protein 2 [Cyprinodon tularosa]